jgi:nucleoid-associated protein YgaU
MIFKGSRYQTARTFSPATGGRDTFPGLRPREVATLPGVVEHTVKAGERLDLLARHYYNDERAWWRIVDANPEIVFAGDLLAAPAEGTIILIPAGKS